MGHYPITRRQNFKLVQIETNCRQHFKGGYLDFSHLTELKNIYITEIYMKKCTNHQELRIIKLQGKKIFLMVFP